MKSQSGGAERREICDGRGRRLIAPKIFFYLLTRVRLACIGKNIRRAPISVVDWGAEYPP